MNEYSIRLARPHCDKCHKAKVSNEETSHETNISSPAISFVPPEVIADTLDDSLRERINADISADSASELKSRLNRIQATPDDEEEI